MGRMYGDYWIQAWKERDNEALKYKGQRREWFIQNCNNSWWGRDIWKRVYERIDKESEETKTRLEEVCKNHVKLITEPTVEERGKLLQGMLVTMRMETLKRIRDYKYQLEKEFKKDRKKKKQIKAELLDKRSLEKEYMVSEPDKEIFVPPFKYIYITKEQDMKKMNTEIFEKIINKSGRLMENKSNLCSIM
jgi:hypothetical protein